MTDQGITTGAAAHRLKVGIIGVGRVGTTIGAALRAAGHSVTAVAAPTERSRRAAAEVFPEAARVSLAEIANHSTFIVISVPDPEIQGVVRELAESGSIKPFHIVAHMAGSRGVEVLSPLATVQALTVAMHPAMTFPDVPTDLERMDGVRWAITAHDPRALAVSELIVMELGGVPVTIDEELRMLYHAALCHCANHLVTLIADAQDLLVSALSDSAGSVGGTGNFVDYASHTEPQAPSGESLRAQASAILRPLVEAALEGTLGRGDAALTGPVARGDTATVDMHEMAIAAVHPDIAAFYAAASQHTRHRVEARSNS